MIMQEEDLRKFLSKFFNKHYKIKMALFDFKEWLPSPNAYRELQYKFNVQEDYIEVIIIGSAYSYIGSRTGHNTSLRFTDNEVLLGYKNETNTYVFELLDKLNKDYPKYVEKLQKRKNRRLIMEYITNNNQNKTANTSFADDNNSSYQK